MSAAQSQGCAHTVQGVTHCQQVTSHTCVSTACSLPAASAAHPEPQAVRERPRQGRGFTGCSVGSRGSGSPTPRQEQEHPPASPLTYSWDGSTREAGHRATDSSRFAGDGLECSAVWEMAPTATGTSEAVPGNLSGREGAGRHCLRDNMARASPQAALEPGTPAVHPGWSQHCWAGQGSAACTHHSALGAPPAPTDPVSPGTPRSYQPFLHHSCYLQP